MIAGSIQRAAGPKRGMMGGMIVKRARRHIVVVVGMPPVGGTEQHHGGKGHGKRPEETARTAKAAKHRRITLDAAGQCVKRGASRYTLAG